MVVKELTYFKCVTIIVTKQLSLIAVINIFSIIVTVVVTIKINHKTTKNVKTLNSNKRKETGMLKRFKFYLISGIVLVLLIVCNFVDKPIAKVGEVKDTVMMKLHTKESMAQIDGQTIYFKKIGEGSLLYLCCTGLVVLLMDLVIFIRNLREITRLLQWIF